MSSQPAREINPTGWYSVPAAAELLGLAPVRIRQLLAYGELKGEKVGRSWAIRGHDLEKWNAQRRPVGRPLGSVTYKLDVLGRRRRVKYPRPQSKLKRAS